MHIITRGSNLDAGFQDTKDRWRVFIGKLDKPSPNLIQEVGQVGIMYLLRRSRCPEKCHGGSVPWNLSIQVRKTVTKSHKTRTIPSTRDKILSRHVAVLLATAFTNKGSKRAASSSLATVRAALMPSVAPGGMRPPLEKASPTDSLTLLVDRERYCDSRVDNERSKRMVSGLHSAK